MKLKIYTQSQQPAQRAQALVYLEPETGGARIALHGEDAAQFLERFGKGGDQYAARVYQAAVALETGAGSANRAEPHPTAWQPVTTCERALKSIKQKGKLENE